MQLLNVAELDPAESVRFAAAAIKPLVDSGYLSTDLSGVSDTFKDLIDNLCAFCTFNLSSLSLISRSYTASHSCL
jgi:hypothetical protein